MRKYIAEINYPFYNIINKNMEVKIMVDAKTYIGNMVEVKIDRQMGTKHPKHGFIYPVNYGYVPNTVSGDGEELDCIIINKSTEN